MVIVTFVDLLKKDDRKILSNLVSCFPGCFSLTLGIPGCENFLWRIVVAGKTRRLAKEALAKEH